MITSNIKKILLLLTVTFSLTLSLLPHNSNDHNFTNNHLHTISNEGPIKNPTPASWQDDHTLPLAFNDGQFFPWQATNNNDAIYGIMTNNNKQAYFMQNKINNNILFTNTNLAISNFMAFNEQQALATFINYHDRNDHDWVNTSFIVTLNNDLTKPSWSIAEKPLATNNNDLTNWGNDTIVATGFTGDIIHNDNTITKVKLDELAPGSGKTSFTMINNDYGLFVANNYHCYLLTKDGDLTAINDDAGNALIVNNPLFTNYFVTLNDNSGIIRTSSNELSYLTLNGSDVSLQSLQLDGEKLTTTTNNFFSKLGENNGILNINRGNGSNFWGQPYELTINNDNTVTIIIIGDYLMSKAVNLNAQETIFIDNRNNAFLLTTTKPILSFRPLGFGDDFIKINNNFGIITTNNGSNKLFSSTGQAAWTQINQIKFNNTTSQQTTTFINNQINNYQTISPVNEPSEPAIDRTNNYISTDSLQLHIKSDKLLNVSIDGNVLNPNNNEITTRISASTNNIKIAFADFTINYQVLINNNDISLPTFSNINDSNYQYVGIVNDKLYDINSTKVAAGFTINFNYQTMIQYVNVITLDATTMYRQYTRTINPQTTFTLPPTANASIYMLETVDWNNNSYYQYFGLFRDNNNLPIPNFWNSDSGKTLWKFALSIGYETTKLQLMDAKEINNLRQLANNYQIVEKQGKILGYIIAVMIIIALIISTCALIYRTYLQKTLKKRKKY